MLINLLLWAFIGAAAGWIASFFAKGRGWMENTIIGVIGAIAGGFVMNIFGKAGITGFNVYSLIIAVIGAIVLLNVLQWEICRYMYRKYFII